MSETQESLVAAMREREENRQMGGEMNLLANDAAVRQVRFQFYF